jgi:hypothetical protein
MDLLQDFDGGLSDQRRRPGIMTAQAEKPLGDVGLPHGAGRGVDRNALAPKVTGRPPGSET